MKYRVEIDVAFDTEDEAISLLNLVEEFKARAFKDTVALSSTKTLEQVRTGRYHKCYHDEDPPKACGAYQYINFDGVKTEWKNSKGDVVASTEILKPKG